MSDIELISFILKGFAAFGLSMLLFALMPKTPARRFLALLISSFIAFTFAKTPQQQSLGNRESAANVAQREQLSALMSEADESDDVGEDSAGGEEGGDEDEDIYDYVIIEEEDDEEDEDEPIVRVDIAAIVCANGVVSVEFKWPQEMEIHKWDVFLMGYEELGGDVALSKKYNPTSGTNLVVSVTAADFPENDLPHKYFFKAEAVKDSDHDGLSDELEIEWGTNPNVADSDNDGLNDKFEVDNNYDPTCDDMDGDGVRDGEECNNGTLPWIDEAEMETLEGIYYVITGTVHEEEIPYDPSTNQTSRVASDELPPNQPGIFSNIGYEIQDVTSNIFCKVKTGLNFRPTQSGYFAFQIAADDRAEVYIGNVKLTDSWQTRGVEKIGYFEAERDYEIVATIWNNGGRTYFNFVKFGEFRFYPVIFNASMTPDFVLYEGEYIDKNGVWAKGESSKIEIIIEATGGLSGAELSITNECFNCLKYVGGKRIETGTFEVSPGAHIRWRGIYEGCSPSTKTNDVKLVTSFSLNSDDVLPVTITNVATVAELFVAGEAVGFAEARRHVFGPLEEYTIGLLPKFLKANWDYSTEEVLHSASTNIYTVSSSSASRVNSLVLRAPHRKNTCNIHMSLDRFARDVSIDTITPKGWYGTCPRKLEYEDWPQYEKDKSFRPTELWGGFVIAMRLIPSYVSFNNVQVMEGESEAYMPLGSFKNLSRHNKKAGAWSVIEVSDGCDAGYDRPMKNGLQPDNDDWYGSGYWEIPLYWRTRDDATNIAIRCSKKKTYKQSFFCTSGGELRIEKFGFGASRSFSDGKYYIYEVKEE